MALIELKEVDFTYRGAAMPALKNVSLTIDAGEFVGIIGPTGAGKSTLSWVISGVIPQIILGRLKGNVTVKGLPAYKTPVAEISQIIGLVQQDAEAQLLMTDIEKEITFPLENLRLSPQEIDHRLNKVLDLVGLQKDRFRHPFYLSGGQKQRVAIAACLAMEPEVLILDEATSELDPLGAEEVHNLAGSLKEEDKTIIMVEHNIDELAKVADRIVVMDKGEILMDAPVREVLSKVDFLQDLGIYPPQVTQTAYSLQKMGIALERIPITYEEGLKVFSRSCNHD